MKPIVTEKAIMMVESQNILTFVINRRTSKDKVKQEVEEIFKVKVDKVRSLIKKGKKYVYVRLKPDFPAIDVATKLGLI